MTDPVQPEPDERDVVWELGQAEYATRTRLTALRGALAELDRVREENKDLREWKQERQEDAYEAREFGER